ncbi:hypothetical protein [Halorubellus sp. PRR65]|uniref:hypothetical protein n=1 Tax=Halorubellus sp. PRR65 TaxID=3098148 RepID=UPI002B25CECB|nr:hypothetical protein [Halorubellus sp. PRR65]
MVPRTNRRTVLLATAATAIPLSGCADLGHKTQTATVHLVNETRSEQEMYTDLTKGEETHVFGQLATVPAASARRIEADVQPGTYELLVNVDDIRPRPRATTNWEIAESDCENSIYCTLTRTDDRHRLTYLEHECVDRGAV